MTTVLAWMRRLISGSGHIESKASVKVRRIHREGVEVAYQDSAQALTFKGELVGPRWKQVNIVVDRDARLDSRVLDNLAAELSRQKYQFCCLPAGRDAVGARAGPDCCRLGTPTNGLCHQRVRRSPDRAANSDSRGSTPFSRSGQTAGASYDEACRDRQWRPADQRDLGEERHGDHLEASIPLVTSSSVR